MQHPKIKHWDDERKLGNALILTTACGWAFEANDNESVARHVKGFATIAVARKAIKELTACKCGRCTRGDI